MQFYLNNNGTTKFVIILIKQGQGIRGKGKKIGREKCRERERDREKRYRM